MKKEMSEIKRRALLAKQRMKMGYWQRMQAERDRMLGATADSSKIELASALRKSEFERANNRALGDDFARREERLYMKVREILDRDENVTDPDRPADGQKKYTTVWTTPIASVIYSSCLRSFASCGKDIIKKKRNTSDFENLTPTL